MIARILMPPLVLQSSVGDDRVLRDVDETARQVARVRGLQRGVGETLAGAVRRVEVLENREAFLEVGDDRALDDFARRLRHQAAHAGELLHLRRRTARSGVRHHVDRIDRDLAVGLRSFLTAEISCIIASAMRSVALRPGVDHLVVLLALRDQAVLVLLLVFLRERARLLDHLPLGVRHDHVVLAERDAGLERMMEAERHDAVAEDHRLLLAAVAIDRVDHRRRFRAWSSACWRRRTDTLVAARQHLTEHDAARRGVVPAPRPPCRSRRAPPSGT